MLSSIRSEPTLSRLAGMGWVSPDRRFIPSGWRQSGSYSVMSCQLNRSMQHYLIS